MRTQFERGFESRDENGYYTLQGVKYPSVTTVLGFADDFLWVHLTKIKNLLDEIKTQGIDGEMHERWIEHDGKFTKSYIHPKDALLDSKYVAYAGLRHLKACADRGTAMHELKADYASGAWPSIKQIPDRLEEIIFHQALSCKIEDVIPYGVQLWKYLDKRRPQIVYSEYPAFNISKRYAGRPDCIWVLDGEMMVEDAKSQAEYSCKRIHFAQASAYAHSQMLYSPEGVIKFPRNKNKILPVCVLYVTPDRCGLRILRDHSAYYKELFLPALQAFHANKELPLPEKCVWNEEDEIATEIENDESATDSAV